MSSDYPLSDQEPEKESEGLEAREVDESVTSTPRTSPGRMLKEARLAKNIKRYDVAKRMCLSVKWIKDLEHDHYSKTSALIYIRGYLRSYAKLLDVPVEEIIAAFESLGVEEEFERIKEENLANHFIPRTISTLSYTKPPSSRRFMRWITLFSVLAAVLWLGIWWKGRHQVNPIQAVANQPSSSSSKEIAVQPVAVPTSNSNTQSQSVTPSPETMPATGHASPGNPPVSPQTPNNPSSNAATAPNPSNAPNGSQAPSAIQDGSTPHRPSMPPSSPTQNSVRKDNSTTKSEQRLQTSGSGEDNSSDDEE